MRTNGASSSAAYSSARRMRSRSSAKSPATGNLPIGEPTAENPTPAWRAASFTRRTSAADRSSTPLPHTPRNSMLPTSLAASTSSCVCNSSPISSANALTRRRFHVTLIAGIQSVPRQIVNAGPHARSALRGRGGYRLTSMALRIPLRTMRKRYSPLSPAPIAR